EIKMIR
ncbi:hypothetical protein DTQ60_01600, partial [Ureaplasma urealyticum]